MVSEAGIIMNRPHGAINVVNSLDPYVATDLGQPLFEGLLTPGDDLCPHKYERAAWTEELGYPIQRSLGFHPVPGIEGSDQRDRAWR